jgi:hypothetical protein
MKLVKVAPAVRSWALYNSGAKPAQWQIQTDDGTVLFDAKGSKHGYQRPTYNLYKPGEAPPVQRGLSFAELRAIVKATGAAQ